MFSCFCSSVLPEEPNKLDDVFDFTDSQLRDFSYVAQKYEEMAARNPEIQRIRALYYQERLKLEAQTKMWVEEYLERLALQRESDNGHECPICYEKKFKNEFESTVCGHVFCKSCLKEVLKSKKPCCPLCRSKF